jgi:hypothetical protein
MSFFGRITEALGLVHIPNTSDIQQAGGHAISANLASARTHHQALDTYAPSNWASIRSAQRIQAPTYATQEDVEVARQLEAQTRQQLRNAESMYKSLANVDGNDLALHQTHRKYETRLLKNETKRRTANAKHAVAAHRERPKLAAAHASIEFAEALYNNQVGQVQARLQDRKSLLS